MVVENSRQSRTIRAMLSSVDSSMYRPCVIALFTVAIAALPSDAQDGARHAPPPTPVRVEVVRETMLAPRKRVFGELRASQRSTLAVEEPGIVREMLAREGDIITQGDAIARLDATRMDLELLLHASNRAAMQAALVEQQAICARAHRDLQLLRLAEAAGGTNAREVADAESEVSIAQAKIALAQANLEILNASGALLEERLRDHVVRAPFTGVVTKKHVDAGAWLAEGAAVVDLQATDKLEAWFEVPQELFEQALVQVELLQHTSEASASMLGAIQIRDALDHSIVVRSLRVVPAIDPRSRSFSAILDVESSGAKLAAGFALTGFIPTGASAPRLVISRDSIVHGDAGPFVYVVRDGIAVPLQIRIDFPMGDEVAIEAVGLTAGSSIIVEGNERLTPMSRVAPIVAATITPATGDSK
ncbi:MAG: efflux RND transporter periplasmic adaptor subunit [Phycisphaerales bacterium]|nr:efflux RND transporter periplasmic adaptor subunit [Phycisphaerales bacterium]